jgi:tetratricopeptide (TPR) repeat protein
MTAIVYEKQRHIFPRWRSFEATSSLGELVLPATRRELNTDALDESLARGISEWKEDPSLWRGLDLLGTAVVAGRLDEFAALIAEVRENPNAPRPARDVFEKSARTSPEHLSIQECESVSDQYERGAIKKSRVRLATAPRDAIEWVELARAYTIAGLNEKARRAISAALQLAPVNRFVLRSAARFFLHYGDRDRALALLSRSPILGHDPWIMASEIAIADSIGKSSKVIRIAREKIEAGIAPTDLTELASALGSLEAENGNDRIARRHLRRAIVGANENSIAQIGWLNRSQLNGSIDVSFSNPPLLHEAKAWSCFYRGDFEVAQQESLCWLIDQPFASAPAALASYIASDLLWNFEKGKTIAQAGLMSNPDDPLLLNNLAVCLLEIGELDAAETALARIKPDEAEKRIDPAYKATFGMLAFRRGNTDKGRKLYLEAIEKARSQGSKATAARANFHLIFEEIAANSPNVEDSIHRLEEYKDQKDMVEMARFFERVNILMHRNPRSTADPK